MARAGCLRWQVKRGETGGSQVRQAGARSHHRPDDLQPGGCPWVIITQPPGPLVCKWQRELFVAQERQRAFPSPKNLDWTGREASLESGKNSLPPHSDKDIDFWSARRHPLT